MSLKLQIETAKDAVSKALITALQDKNETAISDLFDVYNKLVSIQITEKNKTIFNIGGTSGIHVNPYDNITLCSSMSDDVISFSGLG